MFYQSQHHQQLKVLVSSHKQVLQPYLRVDLVPAIYTMCKVECYSLPVVYKIKKLKVIAKKCMHVIMDIIFLLIPQLPHLDFYNQSSTKHAPFNITVHLLGLELYYTVIYTTSITKNWEFSIKVGTVVH